MFDDPAYVQHLLQKLFEGTTTPSETDFLFLVLEFYTEEEIEEMLAQINPTVDDEKYRRLAEPTPPIEVLMAQFYQRLARKKGSGNNTG